jgi:putative DNA primase/helicase
MKKSRCKAAPTRQLHHASEQRSASRKRNNETRMSTNNYTKSTQREQESTEEPKKGKRESQATLLVKLLESKGELFHDGENSFVSVRKDGHRETYLIPSKDSRSFLQEAFYKSHKKMPSSQATQDAIDALRGRARFSSPEKSTAIRVAGNERKTWIDLGRDDWTAVEITADEWKVVPHPDKPRFWRSQGIAPFPTPTRDGTVDDLRDFLSLTSEDDFYLTVAYIMMCFNHKGPFPVLNFGGSPGSGKSTKSKIVRWLTDPSEAPTVRPPTKEDNLTPHLAHSWVVCFDNVSSIPDWLSDELCRISTGEGIRIRSYYTNLEEIILHVKRPIMLNSIGNPVTRGDLVDRTIFIACDRIKMVKREDEFWKRWDEAYPGILGGIFDALVGVLRHYDESPTTSDIRMADFAAWGIATEKALGWPEDSFINAYRENRGRATGEIVEHSLVAQALIGFVRSQKGAWVGRMGELLSHLNVGFLNGIVPSDWPKTPQALSNQLEFLKAPLEKEGLLIETVPTNRKKHIYTIIRPELMGDEAVTSVTSNAI